MNLNASFNDQVSMLCGMYGHIAKQSIHYNKNSADNNKKQNKNSAIPKPAEPGLEETTALAVSPTASNFNITNIGD
jgi:hypothetical protein